MLFDQESGTIYQVELIVLEFWMGCSVHLTFQRGY